MENLSNIHKPTWCPGCGNFGILQALKNGISQLSLKPNNTVLVYDIGCNSNMFNWLEMTAFEGLHGRTLPIATGIKMVNPKLKVIAIAGDGGCYGEGGNHLLHAARRNLDITLLVHDNQVYALTTGQTSPSSDKNFKSKSTPDGNENLPLNPIAVSLAAGASFVARGFAGDISHLTNLMVQAIQHQGFSVVDILQPCLTFNQVNTFDWYKQRVYDLNKQGFKTNNKLKAIEKALEWPMNGRDSKIPLGIFFEEEREVFQPQVDKKISSIENLIKEFL